MGVLPLLLAACAATPALDSSQQRALDALLPVDILLLGEQHDAPEHQDLERALTQALADRGELAALVLEMAERGHDTRHLLPGAGARQVRDALAWNDRAWPWKSYGPAVMAAVRAGVPVSGGNLPRSDMGAAMQDPALDRLLPANAWAEQQQRIRSGHCDALPEARILPMTRVQIARDRSLAQEALRWRRPGRSVLVLAGNGHVERELGIPVHLPGPLRLAVISLQAGDGSQGETTPRADRLWITPPAPARDDCARLPQLGPQAAAG